MNVSVLAIEQSHWQSKFDSLGNSVALLLLATLPLSTSLTNVLLILILPFVLFSRKRLGDFVLALQLPITWVFLGLYGLYLVGVTYSSAPVEDVLHTLSKMRKLLYFPILIPFFMDPIWRKWALNAFVIGTLVNVMVGALAYVGLIGIVSKYGAQYLFKDSIHTSAMVALADFISLHRLFEAKTHKTIWTIVCVVLLGFGLVLSIGRTGQVVLLALVALAFVQRNGITVGLIQGGGAVVLLTALSYTVSTFTHSRWETAIQDVTTYEETAQTSVGLRLSFWQNSLELVKEHPWFGWGTGGFKKTYREHANSKGLTGLSVTENPHNEYCFMSVQMGAIGLLGLLFFFFVIVRQSLFLPSFEKWVVQGMVAAVMIGSLANSWLTDFTTGFTLVIVAAACFAANLKKGVL